MIISQECGELYENGGPFDVARMKKDGPGAMKEPIVREGEIGRTFSRAGENGQLVFQQEVLGNQDLCVADAEALENTNKKSMKTMGIFFMAGERKHK